MLKDGRIIQELPKSFYNAKREFEKAFTFAIAKAKNEDKNKELDNYAVLFSLIQEFNNFLFKYEEEVSVALKDRMDELNKYKVLLNEYGKKVFYDDEASWLFISDMNKKDWVEFDEKCNKEFLENKKDK